KAAVNFPITTPSGLSASSLVVCMLVVAVMMEIPCASLTTSSAEPTSPLIPLTAPLKQQSSSSTTRVAIGCLYEIAQVTSRYRGGNHQGATLARICGREAEATAPIQHSMTGIVDQQNIS